MNRTLSILALGLLGAGWVSGAEEKSLVPPDAFGRLLARSTAVIQEALKDDTPNRRAADRARVVAVILAEAAQQDLAGADAGKRATTRDAALDLARLIRGQEFAKARKLAQGLPSLPPSASAKKEKIPLLGAHIEMDEVMSVFRKLTLGGLEIESEFDRLENDSENQIVPAADLTEKLELFAYQTALAADLVKNHKPDKEPAQWRQRSELMRQSALELALAVKAKDGKAAYRAVSNGNANCTACHKTFR